MYLQVFDFRNTNPQQEGNITKCRQNAQKILSCDYPKIGVDGHYTPFWPPTIANNDGT
jgi:hypothetical protein